jgi:hypothetical protein
MFNQVWFATIVKVVGKCFHNNFRARFQTHLLGYRGFGLGITFAQQRFAREQIVARMWLDGHVPTKLQLFFQQE